MRLWIIALLIPFLLVFIPLATAQELDRDFTRYTVVESGTVRLEDYIGGFACPVGIRDVNRDLLLDNNGFILAGQVVRIPRRLNEGLCRIEYYGAIEFFDWKSYREEHGYPNYGWELEAFFNVCNADMRLLNPHFHYQWPDEVRIPLDTPPCFRTVELRAGQSPYELALELNICENLIWYYNNENIYEESAVSRWVSIPLSYMPCYVDGQVLVHDIYLAQTSEPHYIPAEIIQLEEPLSLLDFAIQESYCYKDIEPANRGKSPMTPYQQIYIPLEVPRCQYLEPNFEANPKSILEIAREYNVCLENLLRVNYFVGSWAIYDDNEWGVWVPIQAPCYDENGLRLGRNDKAVHQTTDNDWLFGIAQQYQVCIADLFAANPLLETYPYRNLPSIVFIPDVPPCSDVDENGFVHHIVRGPERYSGSNGFYHIAYIYNVCEIDLIFANPQMVEERPSSPDFINQAWTYELRNPVIGESILVPIAERPCYSFEPPAYTRIDYYDPFRGREIQYICYAQEIDLSHDYTGHEPPISPLMGDEGPYCYDKDATPFVIIDNVTYAIYPAYNGSYVFELAECFGVSGYDIVELTNAELRIDNGYPNSVWYYGIPNPQRDCLLIGNEHEAAISWQRNFRAQHPFGVLNDEGEYGVERGDTLLSISWEYGYLPEWIMAENNLPSDKIYIYQRLRLPNYPSLYQISLYVAGLIGTVALLFGASFVLRLRANRRKGKKKKDD